MLKAKRAILLTSLLCLITPILVLYWLVGVDVHQLQTWLEKAGFWTPIIYIVLYILATLLILPSTALNLLGGALFGAWVGTLWTSVGAIAAAIISFGFTRSLGREWVTQRIGQRWQVMDAEIQQGGVFYMFAIRLLPIIPYGLVNFAAGLTSIRFKDYLLGTVLGTVPGILPFVMLGSYGLKAVQTGDIFPLLAALTLIGMLVAAAARYRRQR